MAELIDDDYMVRQLPVWRSALCNQEINRRNCGEIVSAYLLHCKWLDEKGSPITRLQGFDLAANCIGKLLPSIVDDYVGSFLA